MALRIMVECCCAVSFMPTVAYAECHKLALYVGFHYAVYRYAECHYTECHYPECQNAQCHYAERFTKIS